MAANATTTMAPEIANLFSEMITLIVTMAIFLGAAGALMPSATSASGKKEYNFDSDEEEDQEKDVDSEEGSKGFVQKIREMISPYH